MASSLNSAALLVGALLALPALAGAQSSATVQITATVVPTSAPASAWQEVSRLAGRWRPDRPIPSATSTLLGRIEFLLRSPSDPSGRPAGAVVTVSYLKN